MKLKFLLFVFSFFMLARTFGQVAINTDGSRPDTSAMLDVKSTNRGLLIPRVTTAQMVGIHTPADGLMVYNTDLANYFFYLNNPNAPAGYTQGWIALSNSNSSSGGLQLPFAQTANTNGTSFAIINSAAHGNTADFSISNLASDGYALKVATLGKKSAGYFIGNSYANALTTGIGNVGIGIDSAAAHMHIFGGSTLAYPQLMFETNLADSNNILFKNHGLANFWAVKSYNSPYNSLERFNFYNSRYGNVLSLAGDGRVGIGTDTPAAQLQINAVSAINKPQLLLFNQGNDYARLSLQNSNSSNYWTIAGYNSMQGPDELNFYNSQSVYGNVLSITSDSKVGINTAQPTQALDVNGNANIQGGINFIGPMSMGANPGIIGQVLTSNGPGVQPQWKTAPGTNINSISSNLNDNNPFTTDNVGYNVGVDTSFTLYVPTKVLVTGIVTVSSLPETGGVGAQLVLQITLDGQTKVTTYGFVANSRITTMPVNLLLNLPTGSHTIGATLVKFGQTVYLSDTPAEKDCYLIYQFY